MRECKYCGKKFKPRNSRQNFCKLSHSKKYAQKGRRSYNAPTKCAKVNNIYRSELAAKRALAEAPHEEIRYYWCNEHHGYHLTSRR
jgi:hypothetical protein